MRVRRVEVRRAAGRRRLRFLAWSAVALVLVVAAMVATRTALLDVDRLVIVGAMETEPAVVLDAVGIALGDPLVELDLGGAGQRVARLPWVAEASVTKGWDGTVTIRVAERTAVAAVAAMPVGAPGEASSGETAAPAAWSVVDGSGRVLDVRADAPAGLPRLEGVTPAGAPGSNLADDADAVLRAAVALPAPLAATVTSIVLSDGNARSLAVGEVELVLADGAVIRLGPATDLADKLVAAATVIERQPNQSGCVEVLDVRVPASPALTPRADCA